MILARKTKTHATQSGLGPSSGAPDTTGVRAEYRSAAADTTGMRVEYRSAAADTTGMRAEYGWGRDGSVGIGDWTVRGSNPGKGEISALV
jgi:hypothetical protein